MLTAEKFDEGVLARAEVEKFKVNVQENRIINNVDWEREVQEQEFKQSLLEGRVNAEQRRQSVSTFKFFLWIK